MRGVPQARSFSLVPNRGLPDSFGCRRRAHFVGLKGCRVRTVRPRLPVGALDAQVIKSRVRFGDAENKGDVI